MDSGEFFGGDELVVRRSNGSSLAVNLRTLIEAEHRCDEVESVTPSKAPELLSFLNRACRETHQLALMVLKEKQRGERDAKRIRGRLILDEIPTLLKEKGLASARSPAGNEDLREAVLDTNEEYLAAQETVQYLDSVYELINGKLQSFSRAFYAVKGVIGNNHHTGYNRFSAGADDTQESGMEAPSSSWRDVPESRRATPAGPPGSIRSRFGR